MTKEKGGKNPHVETSVLDYLNAEIKITQLPKELHKPMHAQSFSRAKEHLLDKVSRMELAANRGLKINAEFAPLEKGSVLSVEGCNVTIKNCQLFRKWINEFFGSSEQKLAPTFHDLE